MIRPVDETSGTPPPPPEATDRDERIGEAVEAYLELIEHGESPDPDQFAAGYPGLVDDVRAALQGLELVNGLVGRLPGGPSGDSSARPGAPGRALESGRNIAGYRIVRELGRGGMGTVYEAVHIALDRPVALKILGSRAAPDSSARRRFLNEARTAARLHHTNIVPVFDVGQVGGLCYYAMQRIEGAGLDRVLSRLRRVRGQSGGAGSASFSTRNRDSLGTASSPGSTPSSRMGQFWFRVSEGWLKRPIRESSEIDPATGTAVSETNKASRRRSGPGSARPIEDGPGDPTGSWAGLRPGSPPHGGSRPRGAEDSRSAGLFASAGVSTSEFLPGRPEEVEDDPPFTPPRGAGYYRWVAEIGLQAAEALTHAHHHGVIHRDVKPSNLLVDARGALWVTDFGLARRLADPGLTQHDSLLGTPRYMSPEQTRPGPIDGRTDVFSLGGTLYELLALRPAFNGRSAAELVEQIAKLDPPAPRSIDPRIPRDLETIVLKMLAKRPVDRYSSAASLAEDLARFLNHEPVKARRISPVGRLWRIARRHPGITGVSTAAAVVILAVATFSHIRVVTALGEAVSANRLYLRQLATSRWQNAALIRLTPGLPERRAQGLELIKKAAELDPDPELKQKLRDEAVDFLVLKDVVKYAELETGRARNLGFTESGSELKVLTDEWDGDRLDFWDVDEDRSTASIALDSTSVQGGRGAIAVSRPPGSPANEGRAGEAPREGGRTGASEAAADRSTPGPGPGIDGGGQPNQPPPPPSSFGRRGPSNRMAVCGRAVAVILPSDRAARAADAAAAGRMVDSISMALAGTPLPVFILRDRGVRLFDATTGKAIGNLHTPMGSVQGVYGGIDGRRLVTIDQEFLVNGDSSPPHRFEIRYEAHLWDPRSPETPLAKLELPGADAANPPGSTPHVGFSPDGDKLVVGWGSLLTIYSAWNGSVIGRIDAQTQITSLAVGPNDLLAAAGVGNVQLWDLESAMLLSSLTPSESIVSLMRFGPEGSVLALVGRNDPTVELIDPLSHSQIAILRRSDRIQDLAFSPDGRRVAACGQGRTTTVWTILGSTARVQLSGFGAAPSSLAFDDRGLLAVGAGNGEIWTCRPSEHIGASCTPLYSDSANRSTPAPSDSPANRPPQPQTAGRPAPDPLSISTAAVAPDPASDRESGRAGGGDHEPRSARQRPRPIVLAYDDHNRLVVAHEFEPLRIQPERTDQSTAPTVLELPLPRFDGPQRGFSFPSLSSTDGGSCMLAASRFSGFFLWRSESPGAIVPIDPPPTGRTRSGPPGRSFGGFRFGFPRIAPGGNRIYLVESDVLRIWNLHRDGERLQAEEVDRPTPHDVGALALSPDGGLLALASRTGGIHLLETRNLNVTGSIRPTEWEEGDFAQSIIFAPDGRTLAAASQRGPIVVCELVETNSAGSSAPAWKSGLRYRLPVHRAPVRIMAFDSQGDRLAGAGTDSLVEVWSLKEIRSELTRLGLVD